MRISDLEAGRTELETKRKLWEGGLGDRICAKVAVAAGSTVMLGIAAASAHEMVTTPNIAGRILYGVGFVYGALTGSGIAIYGVRDTLNNMEEREDIRGFERALAAASETALAAD